MTGFSIPGAMPPRDPCGLPAGRDATSTSRFRPEGPGGLRSPPTRRHLQHAATGSRPVLQSSRPVLASPPRPHGEVAGLDEAPPPPRECSPGCGHDRCPAGHSSPHQRGNPGSSGTPTSRVVRAPSPASLAGHRPPPGGVASRVGRSASRASRDFGRSTPRSHCDPHCWQRSADHPRCGNRLASEARRLGGSEARRLGGSEAQRLDYFDPFHGQLQVPAPGPIPRMQASSIAPESSPATHQSPPSVYRPG